jgi:valyl-tRNA synthetase
MTYSIPSREAHRQQFWQENNTYAFDLNDNSKPIYSIDTPPPTVSGNLHIWHIFSYTQAEIIARYKRMTGHNVYYPVGYDDNGIPTEILVHKELWDQAKDMDRKTFVTACLDVTAKYRDIYKSLRQSVGMSFDRSMTYSTISPFVQKIAQQRFVEMLQSGAIVRKEFPALRDRSHQTTIAFAETEEKEEDAFFNDVRFEVEWGGEIIIATTRPELMPACVWLFVNPEDSRYTSFLGKFAITPFGHRVPILADDKAKMDKGTGAVMCCSYGDETDIYWIMTHNLETRIIVGRDGRIHNSGVEEIENLKPKQAREAIIPVLEAKWALVKRTAIRQGIVYSERGKVPVEIIPVTQWFINIIPIKDQLITYANEMKFLPAHMQHRYDNRVENLQRDWNISRSRSFGIPIPVWYSKKTGEIILPDADQYPVDPLSEMPKTLPAWHTADDVACEEMVLDTWFTSGISIDINNEILKSKWRVSPPSEGGGEAGGSHQWQGFTKFSLRPQAHDIIRTWLLYTVVQSHYARGSKPFDYVMISWHVLAGKNEKISKSKDNAKAGPKDLLEKFGADATRYRSASGQLGKDIVFEETELKNGQRLITKLRNACQFVKIHIETTPENIERKDLYPTDQRILSRLNETITKVSKAYENYEVGLAKIAFEDFFWKDFCDNYLELIKNRLYKPELYSNWEQLKSSAQFALGKCFWTILRLIAPIIPHVTEELYQDIFKSQYQYKSIHLSTLPTAEENITTISATNLIELVWEIRWYKTTNKLSLGAELENITISWPQSLLDELKKFEIDLLGATKANSLDYVITDEYKIEIQ